MSFNINKVSGRKSLVETANTEEKMSKKTLIFIFGNLTAFGPFVTDFYLPCLPKLTSHFAVSASLIQVSITAGMLGLAAGQLVIGPIADKYGRKQPLLWCLVLFILATIGCMMSTSITMFVLFRLLQGLTGASGLVISKALIADSFSAAELAKYFAILAAVQGAAPIVAPVVGGVAFSLSSWQGAFAVLAVWATGLLWLCGNLDETLKKEDRLKMPVWKTFRCYSAIVRDSHYLVMNLLQGFASAALMAYISASPFIFQNHFGQTPLAFSFYFAANATGLVAGSSVVMKISRLEAAMKWSSVGLFLMAVMTSIALLLSWPFMMFECALFLMLFCVGMLTPVSITLALSTIKDNRGMAVALLGAIPFMLGGVVAPLTGLGDIVRSTSVSITVCSAVCLVLLVVSLKTTHKR